MEKKIYTIKQIQKMFGVSKQTVYTWIKERGLRKQKIGGKTIIYKSDLEEFIHKSSVG